MKLQRTFKALSDLTRQEILNLLKEGPLTAGEIARHFQVSGATISHHLSILKEAGLVLDDRRGKYIYYELNMSVVDELLGWVIALKGEEKNEKKKARKHMEPRTGAGLAGVCPAHYPVCRCIPEASPADSHQLGI